MDQLLRLIQQFRSTGRSSLDHFVGFVGNKIAVALGRVVLVKRIYLR